MSLLPSLCGIQYPRQRRSRIPRPHFNNLYASFMLTLTYSAIERRALPIDPAITRELAALARILLASHAPPIFIDIPFPFPSTSKLVAHRITVKRCPPLSQAMPLTVWQAVDIQGLMLHRWEYISLRSPDQRPLGVVGFISDITLVSPGVARLHIIGELPGSGGYIIIPEVAIALPINSRSVMNRVYEWFSPPKPPTPPPPPPPSYQLPSDDHYLSSEPIDLSLTSDGPASGDANVSIADSATVWDRDSVHKRPSKATLRPVSGVSLAPTHAPFGGRINVHLWRLCPWGDASLVRGCTKGC